MLLLSFQAKRSTAPALVELSLATDGEIEMAANQQSVVFIDSVKEDSLNLNAELLLKSKSPIANAKKNGLGRISEVLENDNPMSILQNVDRGVPNWGRIGAFQLNLANPAHNANQLQYGTSGFFRAGTEDLDSATDEMEAHPRFVAQIINACRHILWRVLPALWQPALNKKPVVCINRSNQRQNLRLKTFGFQLSQFMRCN